MARSRKDGRAGAGHQRGKKLPRWKAAAHRREARSARRRGLDSELRETEAERLAQEEELKQAYHEEMNSWYSESLEDWEDWDNPSYLYTYSFQDELMESDYWDSPAREREFEYELEFNLFQAVDRAVRRHGAEVVRQQASVLAAAFDVPSWEVIQCIRLTRSGYIA